MLKARRLAPAIGDDGPGSVPLLIHIGYHKTGTTFLQTGLFRSPGFVRAWPASTLREKLVNVSELSFDPEGARADLLAAAHDDRPPGTVLVASDERLSGTPHAGGFDSALIARRLAQVFPEAKVLIGIREQADAVYSVYQQYVRDGGSASVWAYLHPRAPTQVPQPRAEHWEYDRLIALYQDLFGRERVLVLPFEWLRADASEFLARICVFCDAPPVEECEVGLRYGSFRALTLLIKRPFNRLFVRNALNPAAPFYVKNHEERFAALDKVLPRGWSRPIERRWRDEVADWAGARFAASNRRTMEITGLPLESLGYTVTCR